MTYGSVNHTTALVRSVSAGGHAGAKAAADLLPLVYGELHRIAAQAFRHQSPGHTLQPTALVHEAFLKMIDQTPGIAGGEPDAGAGWQDRTHFLAVAAIAMRQVLVNHARDRAALKRGGGRVRAALDPEQVEGADRRDRPRPLDVDVLALDEALSTLAQLDARKAHVVELRFFAGLGIEHIAHLLGVSKTTIEGDWRMARAWLADQLDGHE